MSINTRQAIIEKYNLADVSKNELHNLVAGIAHLFDVDISTVSIALRDKVVFHTIVGFDQASVENKDSFSTHIVQSRTPLIVEDLTLHQTFSHNPVVVGTPYLRFFAGMPLVIENTVIGAFCIMDSQPRKLSQQHIIILQSLSAFIAHHIRLEANYQQLETEHSLIDRSSAVMINWRYKKALLLQSLSRNTQEVLGIPFDKLTKEEQPFSHFLTPKSANVFEEMLSKHVQGTISQDTLLELNTTQQQNTWINLLTKGFFNARGELQTIQAIATNNTEKYLIENNLNDTNEKMRLLLEASELGTWDYDVKTQKAKVSDRWCSILGFDYESNSDRQYMRSLIHSDDLAHVSDNFNQLLNDQTTIYRATYRIKHAKGHWIWVETYGRAIEFDSSHHPSRVIGTHRDITERKLTEIHQKKQSQLLRFINKAHTAYLQSHDLPEACRKTLSEMVDIADSEFAFIGQLVITNNQRRLFLHAITEMRWDKVSEDLLQLYKDRNLYFDSFDNLFGEVIKTGEIVISNQANTHKASKGTPSGHPPIERFMGLPIKINNKLIGMIGLANKYDPYTQQDAQFLKPLLDALGSLFYAVDLEKSRSEAVNTLKHIAMTDALSGLNNRRSFTTHCQSLDNVKSAIFAMIDIDHFKRVNDTYGHSAGDYVIKMLGDTMQKTIGSQHFLSRMGGEEFSILFHNIDMDTAHQLLLALKNAVEQTQVTTENHTIQITISIGAAVYSHQSHKIDTALIQADKALYKAKEGGRNRLEWFNPNKT